MIYSVAIPGNLNQQFLSHLLREDLQEDLCFALWHPSRGLERETALIQQIILPEQGERQNHGNAIFFPSYFERVIALALENNAGIAFLHSHLGPGWQGMSMDDVIAEKRMAGAAQATTGLPLLGLTLGTDGSWSARFWLKSAPKAYDQVWCNTVRVVGERLGITFNDLAVPKYVFRPELSRTVSAWGENEQQKLMRLHVGIVGVGSVGSIIAETLARIGVGRITLIDFDSVERVNLDRILHSTSLDAHLQKSKVSVIAREIKKSATARPITVKPYENSIIEDEGFRAALDCDILFTDVTQP